MTICVHMWWVHVPVHISTWVCVYVYMPVTMENNADSELRDFQVKESQSQTHSQHVALITQGPAIFPHFSKSINSSTLSSRHLEHKGRSERTNPWNTKVEDVWINPHFQAFPWSSPPYACLFPPAIPLSPPKARHKTQSQP